MENRIAELRRARGLTLKALAERVGTTNQQISHLEKGRRRLTMEWMERIAAALECHPFELVSEDTQIQDERERVLVELFRGLSEEQKDAYLKATSALAKPLKGNLAKSIFRKRTS